MAEPQEAPSPRRWLTVADVARELAVDDSCVYRLCRAGKLGHVRIGAGAGRIRFTPANVEAYITAATVEPKGPDDPAELATGVQIPSRWTRPQGSKPARRA